MSTQPPKPDSISPKSFEEQLLHKAPELADLQQSVGSRSSFSAAGVGRWAAVEAALREHYHKPDLQGARALYAALAAHNFSGPPVWPMIVAPPGSMKTDLLVALDGLPHVHLIDRVTPNTFLSGQIKDSTRPETRNSSSLLHRIGPTGIIAYPDFSTILSMNRAYRGSVLADMRRIYDGHLRKEYGTDEDRKAHEWKGRISFAVATTDEVDRYYSVFQSLGERFVMTRWRRPGGTEAALKAMNQNCEARTRDLRQAVHVLMSGLGKQSPELPQKTQQQIASLAEFAVRGRTHIHRNGRSKEIDYIPEPEAATRLAQQLAQLAKGSALLTERACVEEEDYQLVRRVAFDCIIPLRRGLLDALIRGERPEACKLPGSTLSYVREELRAVGLLEGDALSDLSRSLLSEAGVF
jgi:hypothetical protein